MPEVPPERKMFVDTIRKFARNELEPVADEIDATGEFPVNLYRRLGALGFLGLRLPAEYGGFMDGSPDSVAVMMCVEEIAKASAGFALSVGASITLFAANVARNGNEEQKAAYLPGIASGDKIGCWGLTEPDAGSDALGIKTRAVRAEGGWLLNGRKTFITNAPIADHFIIIARTGGEPGRIDGGTAFILDRGADGLSTGKPLDKMGMRCSPTGEIFLDNVFVPDSRVLGKPGNGFFDMMASLDFERSVAGAINVAIAQRCLEICLEYSKTRTQFGKPISKFQLVQEKIARMHRDIELARTYIIHVLEMIDSGRLVTAQAGIAKWFATEMGTQAALDAIQILGGYGYCREYKVERYMRDAKLLEIGAGTNEINKLLIAKILLGA